ncbi:hypothetical protein Q3G72_000053 [Acer saccharum]|nr:hypothetical protein Q3G72_000053 [Acer saccharum]
MASVRPYYSRKLCSSQRQDCIPSFRSMSSWSGAGAIEVHLVNYLLLCEEVNHNPQLLKTVFLAGFAFRHIPQLLKKVFWAFAFPGWDLSLAYFRGSSPYFFSDAT